MRFDAFVREQFDQLVVNPKGHLNPFTILCQLHIPGLYAVRRLLVDARADPAERLTREFWALEVERGMMRMEAAEIWREMDYGGVQCSRAAHEARCAESALLGCSAFANQAVEDKAKVSGSGLSLSERKGTDYMM